MMVVFSYERLRKNMNTVHIIMIVIVIKLRYFIIQYDDAEKDVEIVK